MKYKFHKKLIIHTLTGFLLLTHVNYAAGQQLVASVDGKSSQLKKDFTIDSFWNNIPETSEKKQNITLNLQSTFVRNMVFMRFSIIPPENLKIASVELFIIPMLEKNSARKLLTSNKPQFNLFFTPKGLDTTKSYYDSAGFKTEKDFFESLGNTVSLLSNTKITGRSAMTCFLKFPAPENSDWVRSNIRFGEYYKIAFRVNIEKRKHPVMFFTNYNGRLNHNNMAKMLFCSKDSTKNLAYYYDKKHLYRGLLEQFQQNIAELGKFKDENCKCGLNSSMLKWQKYNESLSENNYRQNRYLILKKLEDIVDQSRIARNKHLEKVIKQNRQKAMMFPVSTNRNDITPTFTPEFEDTEKKSIDIKACPGERFVISAALWSLLQHKNVIFSLAPFKDKTGKTIKTTINPFWVKCWYQGSNKNVTFFQKMLIPELLVKNPDLVQVDYLNEENILQAYQVDNNTRYYPDDAKTLQPVKLLSEQFTQQIWFYLMFDSQTKPGVYRSEIILKDSKEVLASLPVNIEILDFKLKKSPNRNYFYTRSLWGELDKKLVLNEIKIMKEHGIENIGIYEKNSSLRRVVELMHQGGLDTENIFLQGDGSSVFWTGMNDEQIKIRVERAFKALAGLDYVKNIYFYLPDEASGTRLKKSGEIAAKIRELGGKTWGAANHHWFKTGGTFFDHVNVAGPYVESDTIAAAQKINCKVFSYNNPQGGVEDPERFRKNFGLYLWCKGFNGGMTWAWNWGFGDSWNDFDQNFWRDHNMLMCEIL